MAKKSNWNNDQNAGRRNGKKGRYNELQTLAFNIPFIACQCLNFKIRSAVKVEREVRGLFTDTFVNKPLSYRALTSGKPCRGA